MAFVPLTPDVALVVATVMPVATAEVVALPADCVFAMIGACEPLPLEKFCAKVCECVGSVTVEVAV